MVSGGVNLLNNMEPQSTPRTTADSAKEGRLIVDAGGMKKKKKSIVQKAVRCCGKGGPGVITMAQIPGVSYKIDGNRKPKAKQMSDVNTIENRENLIHGPWGNLKGK